MTRIFIVVIALTFIGCNKGDQDNDIVKDTKISYPEQVNGVVNLLNLNSGTQITPDSTYTISALLGKDAKLEITLIDLSPSGTSDWNIEEVSNIGWTIKEYENGQQELIAIGTGLVDIRFKLKTKTGSCLIKKIENHTFNQNNSIQLNWQTFYKYILAGSINNSNYYIYDTYIPEEDNAFFDVNSDNEIDFSMVVEWEFLITPWYYKNLSAIINQGNFEILTDTSLKAILQYNESPPLVIDTIFQNIYMPKILNVNDTINKDGIWLKNSKLIFSFVSRNDPAYDYVYVQFPGWNDQGYKYMGYRFVFPGDTIYGWLSLENYSFNSIQVRETSHN